MPPAWLLPDQTTFVGRAAELDRLGTILTDARLVTVTGTGGVGKTRLALRAAANAETAFGDGVLLVELSSLQDPDLLPNTVAAVLELSEHDPRPCLDQVIDYLRDRRMLLILDTCEHLIDACALFAEAVLARTEHVTILATSREPLFVAGEREYALAPLTVPRPRAEPGGMKPLPVSGGGGIDGEAVELFAQRASAAAPGSRITAASRADMARLCQYLDGVPLAIELAAVQLRDAPLSELTRRIDHRVLDLRDRAGRERDAADRHQSLRDAIGWSHELCTPAERALWERLSVFAGPVDAEAARQVCAGTGLGPEAVMNALIGLTDKSVLTRTGDDVSRYRMLDTIRGYGAERLAASGTEPQVRARHLRRYLAMADDLAARMLRDQTPKYRALCAEHADIRTALEYATALPGPADRGHPAIQLPVDLTYYWIISARMGEGRYWLTRGLEHAPEDGPDRAKALIARGYVTGWQGDFETALADAEAGRALADDLGDRRLRARGHTYLSVILMSGDRLEEAIQLAEEARELLVPGDQSDVPATHGVVEGYLNLLTGDPHAALRVCERTLRLAPSDGGERWTNGFLYGIIGLALWALGKPDEGSRAVLRGLAMKSELGDAAGVAHCLGAAALVAGAQQRHERAAWLLGATERLWDRFGSAFVGVDVMQTFADQAAQEARASLGDDRYADVFRDAASRPVGQVIDLAVRDADRLPALPRPAR